MHKNTVISNFEGFFVKKYHSFRFFMVMQPDTLMHLVSVFNITMTSIVFQHAAVHFFFFYFPKSWYGVCEIEFSHIGKIRENSDLL